MWFVGNMSFYFNFKFLTELFLQPLHQIPIDMTIQSA